MSYLLDTNIISETLKKNPCLDVINWLESLDSSQCYISVLTLGEIRKGVEKLPDSGRKQQIIQWLEYDLLQQFCGRIVSINEDVADKWGYICAHWMIPAIDGLIAASALVHNLKIVTRNTKDFCMISGLELVNPWKLLA